MKSFFSVAVLYSLLAISSGVGQTPHFSNSILNLYDAFGSGKRGTVPDWGYSALIHYNGKTILFDSGNNTEIFEHNVKALGVDLSKVDFAILSHYHADHFSGFDYLLRVNPKVKLYLPDEPELGAPVNFTFSNEPDGELEGIPAEELYFGGAKKTIVYRATGAFPHSNHEFVNKTREIMPGVFLIAAQASKMGSFDAYPPNSEQRPELDGLPELSLAMQTSKGVVIVTGCSHTKVEDIIRITQRSVAPQIELVAGGYHLFAYDKKYVEDLAMLMKNGLKVHRVAPAHCTGNLAFKIFREVFGADYVHAGLEAEVTFPQ